MECDDISIFPAVVTRETQTQPSQHNCVAGITARDALFDANQERHAALGLFPDVLTGNPKYELSGVTGPLDSLWYLIGGSRSYTAHAQ
jgi:hypothetical protein